MTRWVYGFGGGQNDGRADMRNLLGGKGANLAEMASIGLPVPPGFTITTWRPRSMPAWRGSRRSWGRDSVMPPTRCWSPSAPVRGCRCRA